MAISSVSLSNTFSQWLVATQTTISELNNLESGYYTKTANTLVISSSGIGLIVSNTANFGRVSTTEIALTGKLGVGSGAAQTSIHVFANDAIILPSGNTAQRPTGINGMIRYNSNTNLIEAYANNSWGTVGGASLTNDDTSSTIYYVGLSKYASGAWLSAYVSESKLRFTPETGTFFAANVKTTGLYDSLNRRLVIKNANGSVIWGN